MVGFEIDSQAWCEWQFPGQPFPIRVPQRQYVPAKNPSPNRVRLQAADPGFLDQLAQEWNGMTSSQQERVENLGAAALCVGVVAGICYWASAPLSVPLTAAAALGLWVLSPTEEGIASPGPLATEVELGEDRMIFYQDGIHRRVWIESDSTGVWVERGPGDTLKVSP